MFPRWPSLFNSGLIVGGLCFAIFMVGSRRGCGAASAGRRTASIGALAGIAGAAVGVFPMNAIRAHTFAASAFFNLAWIAVALASRGSARQAGPRFPARWPLSGFVCGGGVPRVHLGLRVRGSGATAPRPQPPPARPSIDVTSILEWLAVIGVIAWTFGGRAWAWRRARRVGAT